MPNGDGHLARPVTLGRHQRELLLESFNGPSRIAKRGGTLGDRKSRHRAAVALEYLGLVQIFAEGDSAPVKMVRLTQRGREVVVDFRDELRHGQRIRWAQKGWQARYTIEDASPTDLPPEIVHAPPEAIPAAARRPLNIWSHVSLAMAMLLART